MLDIGATLSPASVNCAISVVLWLQGYLLDVLELTACYSCRWKNHFVWHALRYQSCLEVVFAPFISELPRQYYYMYFGLFSIPWVPRFELQPPPVNIDWNETPYNPCLPLPLFIAAWSELWAHTNLICCYMYLNQNAIDIRVATLSYSANSTKCVKLYHPLWAWDALVKG